MVARGLHIIAFCFYSLFTQCHNFIETGQSKYRYVYLRRLTVTICELFMTAVVTN